MRMISDDSLLTMVFDSLSHSTGTVTRPLKSGRALQVELAERLEAEDRIGDDAGPLVERPAALGHEPVDHRERDHALEPLELAENQGPVRPRAGERHDQVVAPGRGVKAADAGRPGRAVGRDPVAERRIGADEPARRIVREIAVRPPVAVQHNAHRQKSPAEQPGAPIAWGRQREKRQGDLRAAGRFAAIDLSWVRTVPLPRGAGRWPVGGWGAESRWWLKRTRGDGRAI